MAKSLLSKYLSELGRKGGKARLKSMTAAERKKIAARAGKASGEARRKKAEEKKGSKGEFARANKPE